LISTEHSTKPFIIRLFLFILPSSINVQKSESSIRGSVIFFFISGSSSLMTIPCVFDFSRFFLISFISSMLYFPYVYIYLKILDVVIPIDDEL